MVRTTRKFIRVILICLGLTIILITQSVASFAGPQLNQSEQFDQALTLAELRKQIAGKERMPAEEAFFSTIPTQKTE